LSERHDSIEILFSDNGPGIPDQNSDFIFLPFWTTKPNGSGLGLTIVGETVSDLGGTISLVESELGKGASFRIRIPIQET
jgi:signal transduction histidine kinase